MKAKVEIKTPKGHGDKINRQIQPFFFMGRWKPQKTVIKKDGSKLTWYVEGDASKIYALNKKVALYEWILNETLTSKHVAKRINKKLSKEGQEELIHLLKNQTKVTLTKIDDSPKEKNLKKPQKENGKATKQKEGGISPS